MSHYLTVIHECEDFAVWREGYDADLPRREAAGLTELYVGREHANPNLIGIAFEADDVSRAKAMIAAPQLASSMKAAGIIGTPKVRIRHGDLKLQSAANFATITLTVRDYATALKAYAIDAADRKAAGLTDLGVLRLDEDTNNLLLFWGVSDVARATAFLDSPALANHMVKNAGVLGAPERHFWKRA
jgi:hypothetical protein